MLGNNFLLWEDDVFIICTPFNPHLSYSEGPIVIVKTKRDLESAWQDPDLSAEAFGLAAKVCTVMEDLQLTPWFNLQANGNWGLLPGSTPYFHIYIYGRNKTESWGKPIVLPTAPGTYQNDPMPELDRKALSETLEASL